MTSKIRNLLFRVFFHNLNLKSILKKNMGKKNFTISSLRTLHVFPASNIRELTPYLFY